MLKFITVYFPLEVEVERGVRGAAAVAVVVDGGHGVGQLLDGEFSAWADLMSPFRP
jgi:hypothetical protein